MSAARAAIPDCGPARSLGRQIKRLDDLAELVRSATKLTVLTGAGCSTASGIPDYRGSDGRWKHTAPILWQDFVAHASARQRYWARSLIGWPHISRAVPNDAHSGLARLESLGLVDGLITQNIDGLHQRAGSRRLIELHGRLRVVLCLSCGGRSTREAVQEQMRSLNPVSSQLPAEPGPDGDARLELDFSTFTVPGCPHCGGMIKPDVVFFGEQVPKARVRRAFEMLRGSSALLVVGSSLMTYSGYRFVREAHREGIKVAAINLGRTRADDILDLKITAACGGVLRALTARLAG